MSATDARPIPLKNAAYRVYFPILDADGDLVTAAASLDSERSLDGGTFADCTNEATEVATGSGVYFLDLTAAEMNTDCTVVIVKTGTAGAKTTVLTLYPQELDDIRVAVTHWVSTAVAAPTVAGVPEVDVTHVAGSAQASIATQASVDAVDNFIDTEIADIQARLPAALVGGRMASNAEVVGDKTGYALTSAEEDAIVNKVWDELTAEARTAGSYGQLLKDDINATISSRSSHGAADVWAVATRRLSSIEAADLVAAACNKIADHMLRRTYANARTSSDGDAVAFRSLLGAIGKLVNKWSIAGSTLTVFQEDDVTSTAPGGTQALTATPGADPITALDTN